MDLYHVLNRGVDKRIIFCDTQDNARFVHDMFEFNDTKPASNVRRNQNTMFDVGRRTLYSDAGSTGSEREKIVDIHGWCLMGNHYHLLLSECIEGGISLFLKKLNGGYAKYFNERYKREGTLFQGKTKKILIEDDAHFLHILNYIHFNPLDFATQSKDWRARKIVNSQEALQYLQNYRWSSYLDYLGKKNFPSILTTELFQNVFNNDYEGQVEKYLNDISISEIQSLIIE